MGKGHKKRGEGTKKFMAGLANSKDDLRNKLYETRTELIRADNRYKAINRTTTTWPELEHMMAHPLQFPALRLCHNQITGWSVRWGE